MGNCDELVRVNIVRKLIGAQVGEKTASSGWTELPTVIGAAFVAAKTTSGDLVVGSDSIVTVGCFRSSPLHVFGAFTVGGTPYLLFPRAYGDLLRCRLT